jgi:gluconolactonase
MWFAAPQEIPTRVLTRVPDHLRRLERTEWADANRAGDPVDCFLEGPCYDGQGRLHVVDIPNGRILRIEANLDWTVVAEYPGWPNGLKVQPDGDLLAADYRHGLVRINASTGTTSAVLQTVNSESFKGLNDLTLHADESILFTDQGQTGLQDPTGRVWRLHRDGRLDRLIATGPSPNGLVLNTAQTHLYVAMTRSCEVWRFLLRPDAIVAKAQCFARILAGTSGPDGLAMDSADRLYVANPGHGCVWVIDRHGVPLFRIQSCAGRATTNCALAPDERTLIITESETGSILIAEIPPP